MSRTRAATPVGRARVLVAVAACVVLALPLLALAGACSATTAVNSDPAFADPLVASAPIKSGLMEPSGDWHHLLQVLGYLTADRLTHPVVFLMGGSVTRECTINDLSWRRQIVKLGGPGVMAFNLGSTNQSFDHNIAMVRQLPDVPTLVIIGVNMGRYTWKPPPAGAAARRVSPAEGSVIEPYAQHRFTVEHILSDEAKRELLFEWLGKRQPMFRENFRYNAGKLDELVAVCLERGFHPVILNMPLNEEIIQNVMDRYRARIAANCEHVGAKYHVPYVDWMPRIDLVSGDFFDNWHLVEPGRVKWQLRLSRLTVELLDRYGIVEIPIPSPSPTPSSSLTASP